MQKTRTKKSHASVPLSYDFDSKRIRLHDRPSCSCILIYKLILPKTFHFSFLFCICPPPPGRGRIFPESPGSRTISGSVGNALCILSIPTQTVSGWTGLGEGINKPEPDPLDDFVAGPRCCKLEVNGARYPQLNSLNRFLASTR